MLSFFSFFVLVAFGYSAASFFTVTTIVTDIFIITAITSVTKEAAVAAPYHSDVNIALQVSLPIDTELLTIDTLYFSWAAVYDFVCLNSLLILCLANSLTIFVYVRKFSTLLSLTD